MNSNTEIEEAELSKIESKDIFKNLKNDFFLQKLFNHLLEKKSLQIIKYNKNLKNRINISIYDYRRYSSIYSSIEIEIKPVKNEYEYAKFINIVKENEIYYHIYFNDNKEEIKKKSFNENDNISKIKIIIEYHVKSFSKLFYNCE